MARDLYQNTIALADATGALKALAGVQVYVYAPGTTASVPIYASSTGAAQVSNPIITDATGLVEFYADYGPYDVRFKDTVVPARIADRTVKWNSVSAEDEAIPSDKIAKDAGLSLLNIGADIIRQGVPIGGSILWFRPDSSIPVPSGFEIADGRTIPSGQHDFPIGGAIVLPDTRNLFLMGADISKADGAAAVGTDGGSNGPGIGGQGGSHQHTLSAGQMPVHTHSFTTGAENSSLAHAHNLPFWCAARDGGAPWTGFAAQQFTSGVGLAAPTTFGATSIGEVGNTNSGGPAAHSHSGTTNNAGTGTAHNNMPGYIGFLVIVKVRRS